MTHRDAVDEWESPFLQEALAPEASAEEAVAELRRLGRRLSRRAQAHLARALEAEQEGSEGGASEALETWVQERSTGADDECGCGCRESAGAREASLEVDDAEAYEGFEAEAGLDEAGLEEAGLEEAGLEEAGLEEAGLEETALDESAFEEAAYEDGGSDEALLDEAGLDEAAPDEETDTFEAAEPFAAEDGEAAWGETEDLEAEDASGAEHEEESSRGSGFAGGEDEAFENLAGFNEMFAPESEGEAEDEDESTEHGAEHEALGDARSDETFTEGALDEAWDGPEMESETPAEIQSHLERVVVTSRAETLRRAPNPFGLNAVASKNTESKREVFKAVQRTWHRLLKVEARIARRSTATLLKEKAAIEKTLAEQASALKTWLRAHPLDHSRARAQLQQDIKKHERGLKKLKGQARAAAEGALAGLKATLKALEASLRLAADAYEPLKDFQRQRHVVQVPSASGSVTVRLHDHVIAFATDTAEGLDGNADGDDRAQVTAALTRSGISADKQSILALISVQEGRFSTVNTWDRAVVTFGFTQWTTDADGDGTLCRLMESIRTAAPDAYRRCFQRYGLDVDARHRLTLRLPDGRDLAGREAARHVQTSVKHVAVLSAAGMDPAVQTAQIRFAVAQKMDAMLAHVLSAGGASVRLADLLTSEYAVAVMTDRAVGTGEPGTRAAARKAFTAYMKANPKADLKQATHRTAAGARVLAALEALDRGRAQRYTSLNQAAGSYAG